MIDHPPLPPRFRLGYRQLVISGELQAASDAVALLDMLYAPDPETGIELARPWTVLLIDASLASVCSTAESPLALGLARLARTGQSMCVFVGIPECIEDLANALLCRMRCPDEYQPLWLQL